MQGQWSRDDPSFFLLLCTFLAGEPRATILTTPTFFCPAPSDITAAVSVDGPESLGLYPSSSLGSTS